MLVFPKCIILTVFTSGCYSGKRGGEPNGDKLDKLEEIAGLKGGGSQFYYPNTFTTYGINGPRKVKAMERCAYKGTHGQVRMVPSSQYSAKQVLAANTTCPPQPCGRVCISRFTDTPWFKAYVKEEKSNNYLGLTVEDLPLPYISANLTKDLIGHILNDSYSKYCEEVSTSIEKETGQLAIQRTSCHASYSAECYNHSTFDEAVAAGCTGDKIFKALEFGQTKSAMGDWVSNTLFQYLKNYDGGATNIESITSNGPRDNAEWKDYWKCTTIFTRRDNVDTRDKNNMPSLCRHLYPCIDDGPPCSTLQQNESLATHMALEYFYNTPCYSHENIHFNSCTDAEKSNNEGWCNIRILRQAMFGDAVSQSHECGGERYRKKILLADLNLNYYPSSLDAVECNGLRDPWQSSERNPYNPNKVNCYRDTEQSVMRHYGSYPLTDTLDGEDISGANGYWFRRHDTNALWAPIPGAIGPTSGVEDFYYGRAQDMFGKFLQVDNPDAIMRSAFGYDESPNYKFYTGFDKRYKTNGKEWGAYNPGDARSGICAESYFFLSADSFGDDDSRWTDTVDERRYRIVGPRTNITADGILFTPPYPDSSSISCKNLEFKSAWLMYKAMCKFIVASIEAVAQSNCNNFMYTTNFYGNEFQNTSEYATWSLIGATKPEYTGFKGDIDAIVAESNIIGISIEAPAFGSTYPSQFPGGLIINSTHPLIHTRIQRVLGESSADLSSINCNVARIQTPNIRFENVEFDNTGCQEAAMSIAESHTDVAGGIQNAFKHFKGWDFAAVRLTKGLVDSDPTNIQFTNVKFTSYYAFRKQFPGRPLVSIDNAIQHSSYVNVDGLYISNANDTFDYTIVVDALENVPLEPLDMIMWNYKGKVDFGFFPTNWEVVSYADTSAQDTTGDFYTTAANALVYSDNCRNITDIPEGLDTYIYGTASFSSQNTVEGLVHTGDPTLLIFAVHDQGNTKMVGYTFVGDTIALKEGRSKHKIVALSRESVTEAWETADSKNTGFTAGRVSAGTFVPPPDVVWGEGTNSSFCTQYGGKSCIYEAGRCRTNVSFTSDFLQILASHPFAHCVYAHYLPRTPKPI